MNWLKLKEKFPNSYNEIREYSLKTNTTGKECLYSFLDSKCFPDNFLRINQLKDYEQQHNKMERTEP